MDEFDIHTPTNVIVLSSHTKLIHINAEQKVTASLTSISGQLYEAVCSATMVGKSLTEEQNEQSGGYTFEEILHTGGDALKLIALADTLIDGPFILSQRSLSLPFRGSKNQRILNIPSSLKAGIAIVETASRWNGSKQLFL